MRPGPAERHRPAAILGRLARAGICLGGLAAFFVAVPPLLLAASEPPWSPRPFAGLTGGWEALSTRLAGPLDDALLIHLLCLIGWTVWAYFAFTVLREAAWYITHLPQLLGDLTVHRRHRAALPAHRAMIAGVLGALILALLGPTRAAVAATPMPAPVAAVSAPAATSPSSPAAPHLPASAEKSAAAIPTAHLATPVDASAPRDRLRRSPDGAVLPGDSYTVRPGDTLWDLSRARLGDPLHWPHIYALSKHRTQPDGQRLTDPDELLPGWVLTLPQLLADPHEHTSHPRHPAARPPDPHDADPGPQPTDTPPEPPASEQHTDRQPTPSRTERSEHPEVTPAVPAVQRPAAIGVGEVGLIGVTTAAGIATALVAARARARRRHRPGRDDPSPDTLAPIVRASQHAHLSTRAANASETATPPTASSGTPDGDPDDGAEDAPDPPVEVDGPFPIRRPAPLPPAPPGAVAVGERAGAEVHLDTLTAALPLALDGPGAAAALRALIVAVLAAGARSRPEPAPVRLLVTPGLLDRLGLDAVRLTSSAEVAVTTDLGTWPPDLPGAPPSAPAVLLVDASSAVPGLPTTVPTILLGSAAGHAPVYIGPDGRATLPSSSPNHPLAEVRLFHLAATDATDAIDLLTDAQQDMAPREATPPPPVPNRPDRLPAPTKVQPPEPASDSSDRPITLRLLGGYTITTSDGRTAGQRMKNEARELLAALAAHPHGITTDQIIEYLCLNIDSETAHTHLAALRRSIRRTLRSAIGQPHAEFITCSGGLWHLNTALVSSDLATFTAALARADKATDRDLRLVALDEAAACYAGRFVYGTDYLWADELQENWHRRALDAVVQAAEHHAATDPDAALARLEQAIAWDPLDEAIYQPLVRLQLACRRPAAARRTYAMLARRLADNGMRPSPDTDALLTAPADSAAPAAARV